MIDVTQWLAESARRIAAFAATISLPGSPESPELQFWRLAGGLHPAAAAAMIAAGLVCLLYGWRIFRVLVVINAVVLGVWLGQELSVRLPLPWWIVFITGPLLGIASWPLMRLAVSIMGGLAGAFLGAAVARSAHLAHEPIAAVIGLVALGLLAFVVFRLIVIGFTSVQGSFLAVAGIVGLVSRIAPIGPPLGRAITTRPFVLLLLVVVPAAIGLCYQLTQDEKSQANKKR